MADIDALLNHLALFSEEELLAIEDNAVERTGTKGRVRCIIRNKLVSFTPEERVRQLWLNRLISHYGYPITSIRVEYPVTMGSDSSRSADIVVMDSDQPDSPYIIVEVKKPNEKQGKEQLHSYTNATGAPLAVWSNGAKMTVWNRRDPNYFVPIPRLPGKSQTIDDVWEDDWYISTLADKEEERQRLGMRATSLRYMIEDMEDEVLANAGVDVFEEVFKLIFVKLYDEVLSSRDPASRWPSVIATRQYNCTELYIPYWGMPDRSGPVSSLILI